MQQAVTCRVRGSKLRTVNEAKQTSALAVQCIVHCKACGHADSLQFWPSTQHCAIYLSWRFMEGAKIYRLITTFGYLHHR